MAALADIEHSDVFKHACSGLLMRLKVLQIDQFSKATIRDSPIHGRGLCAIALISTGDIVAIKGGDMYKRARHDRLRPELRSADMPIADGFFIGPTREDECEGGMLFSHHSCDPNIGVQEQIVFIAMRDIRPVEALTHDWASTDDEAYEMPCHCGAANCRDDRGAGLEAL